MAEFAKDGRLTHLPAPLQVIAEKAMSGEVQDHCDYEKVVEGKQLNNILICMCQ